MGDGRISSEELESSGFDMDGDGQLDREELLRAVAEAGFTVDARELAFVD